MNLSEIFGVNEPFTLNFWKAVLAEYVATVIYIITVCGATVDMGTREEGDPLHISFTVGFTVAILAAIFWDISGGHFNPVVTLALALRKKVPIIRCVFYIAVQCAGSVSGAALLYEYTPIEFHKGLGTLSLHPSLSSGFGVLIELTLTYTVIMTVLKSTDPISAYTGFQAPFATGMSVGIGLMMAIPFTGGCLNPIRALGPALIMGRREDQWMYWAGPTLGACLAVFSYDFVFKMSVPSQIKETKAIELHVSNKHAA